MKFKKLLDKCPNCIFDISIHGFDTLRLFKDNIPECLLDMKVILIEPVIKVQKDGSSQGPSLRVQLKVKDQVVRDSIEKLIYKTKDYIVAF